MVRVSADATRTEVDVANLGSLSPLGVIEIDIPSRVDLVTVVRMIAGTAAEAAEALSGDRLDDLRWVMSEATTNAIQANIAATAPAGRVRVMLEVGTGWVRVQVNDEGPGMPDREDVPDMEHPDRLQIEGGFGIPLMQHLTSGTVHFEPAAVGTTVHLELHQ